MFNCCGNSQPIGLNFVMPNGAESTVYITGYPPVDVRVAPHDNHDQGPVHSFYHATTALGRPICAGESNEVLRLISAIHYCPDCRILQFELTSPIPPPPYARSIVLPGDPETELVAPVRYLFLASTPLIGLGGEEERTSPAGSSASP